MFGDSITSALMKRALDGTWQRQKAISANIANHETPGYKAVKISFEDALKNEVRRVGNLHNTDIYGKMASIDRTEIKRYHDHSGSERADGNNVNLDAENIQMAKVQIQYQFLTKKVSDYYSRLRYAISEGKR